MQPPLEQSVQGMDYHRQLKAAAGALDVCVTRQGCSARPYQVEALAWAFSGSGCILGLDMGLGKTLVGLALAEAFNGYTVSFVIPSHVLPVWRSEIVKWSTRDVVYELSGLYRPRLERVRLGRRGASYREEVDHIPVNQWLLVAHETVITWGTLVAGQQSQDLVAIEANTSEVLALLGRLPVPDVLVVDEIHRFGSPNSQRTNGLRRLASHARRVVGLSGTPCMGGLHRLWGPLAVVEPRRWGTYKDFITRYCGAVEDFWGVLRPHEPTDTEALRARLSSNVLLRLRAEDVLDDLPVHTRQSVTVPVTGAAYAEAGIGAQLDRLSKRLRVPGSPRAPQRFDMGEVVELRVMLAQLKVPTCWELLKDMTGEGARVVVWCWHHATTRELVACAPKGISAFRADGEVGDGAVDAWSRTPGGVLAATIPYMGTGLDVLAHHACHQVFLELPWAADELLQAEGRLRRLSQPSKRTWSYFLALDVPFEMSLVDRILHQARQTDDVIDDTRGNYVAELFGVPQLSAASFLEGMK
jgi:hypothetical protein